MTAIVQKATGHERVLYALLAGTGMRIGEILGLEVKHLSGDCKTIVVEQSSWQGHIQTPKTKNAYRQIDINSELAEMVKKFVGTRQNGLLFTNSVGRALAQTNLLQYSLHPSLKELGVEKSGFHAMRRFRITWLRKQRAPEDFIKFWLGHAEQSVTDGYSKLNQDTGFRRQVAEQVGLGFKLPGCEAELMRPTVPSISHEVVEAVTM
jgi:integrase